MKNPRYMMVKASLLFFVMAMLIPGTALAQWNYRLVASFAPPDYHDSGPNGLVQASDGTIFGTTYLGGSAKQGTIFKLGANGLEVVFDFANTEAGGPMGTLMLDNNGTLVGTGTGGAAGSIFKWDANGLTSLYGFGNVAEEGAFPYAGVMQGRDGALYGTTEEGGGYANFGTIWKLENDVSTVLHRFTLEDGVNPWAGLVQGTDGAFYGTTPSGGSGLLVSVTGSTSG